MERYVVDLNEIDSIEGFVQAFSKGFCERVGGHMTRMNLDAFNDFLRWPQEKPYELAFIGWQQAASVLSEIHLYSGKSYAENLLAIFDDNPYVHVVLD